MKDGNVMVYGVETMLVMISDEDGTKSLYVWSVAYEHEKNPNVKVRERLSQLFPM